MIYEWRVLFTNNTTTKEKQAKKKRDEKIPILNTTSFQLKQKNEINFQMNKHHMFLIVSLLTSKGKHKV